MIVQISRTRIIQYAIIFFVTLALWIAIGFFVTQQVEDSAEGEVIVTFKFLAPMKPSATRDLVIEQAESRRQVPFTYHWITASTLQVKIPEKDYPRGQQYRYHFKSAPAMIWPFYVWDSGEFQSQVKLRFVGIEASETVPSRGPVILQFNTNVNPGKIHNYVKGPVPGKLEPAKLTTGKNFSYDYSRWLYWPAKKLHNLDRYAMEITKGLPAENGTALDKSVQAEFVTTPEFLIQKVFPRPGSDSVWLTRDILIETNQRLKSGVISVNGLPGQGKITGNQIKFTSQRVLMPGRIYQVKAHLTSTSNETLDYEYSFTTTNLGNSKWLELKLDPSPTLWLVEGNKTVKRMEVALKSDHLPTGTLYEQSRQTMNGDAALGWLRLNADILLHSLSPNMTDQHQALGLPKTYSCIYLKKEDLTLLLNTLPQGFMLICH